jgi:murein DD-endopeptidase MepM/ murein hydrolase activator NlpD
VKRGAPNRAWPLAAIFAAFCAGMIVEWTLHHYGPPLPPSIASAARGSLDTAASASTAPRTIEPGRLASITASPNTSAPVITPVPTIGVSTGGRLRMPIDGVSVDAMKGGFNETRGSSRPHEAVDLLAPRNTPVHAVEDGTIAKLFNSKAGGITIYESDPTGRLVYYYAHLERYADGLHEGQHVSQGDVIGYVGTSGNAPKNTPHLHLAVFETGGDKRWWKGTALDPYPIFRDRVKR